MALVIKTLSDTGPREKLLINVEPPKQPFAVTPLVGLSMFFVLYPSLNAISAFALAAGISIVTFAAMLVRDSEGRMREAMLWQARGFSAARDLWSSAFEAYVRSTIA